MMTSAQAAEKWKISKRQVNILCSAGKIEGAYREKNRWMIPDDVVYIPARDAKQKSSHLYCGKFLNIGNEGFRSIRNSEYVDKTELIEFVNKCMDTPRKLICVSRPRRFGKSFATKMLCAYYSRGCDSRTLFSDLKISKAKSFEEHLNRYDVLYLDMTVFLSTMKIEGDLVERLEQAILDDLSVGYPIVKEAETLVDALLLIYRETGRKMVLIIDEWDAFFRECKGDSEILNRYILFLRGLFKSSYTDMLFAAVYMTGILPIKKYGHESAVSDFYEYSMVEPRPLQEYIGFTEEEIQDLCEKYHMNYEKMKQWYDGYLAADLHVYNPKSVMESIYRGRYSNYWTKTETYESLRDYISMNFDGLKDAVIDLLGYECREVDTGSFQNDYTSMNSSDDILTLLVHLGYLSYHEEDRTVSIPNDEIREEFLRAIKHGKRTELIRAIQQSDQLLSATWEKDTDEVAAILGEIHNEEVAPDFYNNEQALRSVVKMAYISSMDYYHRMEELPSGKGYADIVFWPKKGCDCPAMIVELKWNKSEQTAITQIREKQYTKALKGYQGKVLLVGINYDTRTKEHDCMIESISLS